MIYLYWYLGIGAVVLILMVAFHHLSKKQDDNSLNDVLADLKSERKSLWFRLLNNVLVPALGGTLIVPFWPVLVFLKVKELVFDEPDRGTIDEPEFAVTREDLQTQLSLQEIEQMEMVFDPLGAAPNLPFGHLNTAWKKFCEGMEPHDSLWSFTAPWTSAWGSKDIRQGYAIVRGEELGPHFITIWKDIEKDADQETDSGKKSDGFNIPAWLRKQAD
jgi:hypothetical protein